MARFGCLLQLGGVEESEYEVEEVVDMKLEGKVTEVTGLGHCCLCPLYYAMSVTPIILWRLLFCDVYYPVTPIHAFLFGRLIEGQLLDKVAWVWTGGFNLGAGGELELSVADCRFL
jgi:hypothetical protein